jgi:signal transduction histidine kinase
MAAAEFDVSEERRRESELRDFAAVAAHDLREPLLGVHVMASLLSRRGGLGIEEQKMVQLLDDGVQRATGLIDSILEYATATDDGASRTEVDCGEVVSEVLATLAPQIEHVDGHVEVGALPTLQASRPGLFRVFQNLIANAFEFHNGDAPNVTVSARHGEAAWAFSVRDNGIGLPKDSAIFEMFKRGGGEHEGSGIGLATCRRIVEAHGGSIWAEPAPGGGSTFLFTLPA